MHLDAEREEVESGWGMYLLIGRGLQVFGDSCGLGGNESIIVDHGANFFRASWNLNFHESIVVCSYSRRLSTRLFRATGAGGVSFGVTPQECVRSVWYGIR